MDASALLQVPRCSKPRCANPWCSLRLQVYRVVKALSAAGLPFRSLAMTGGQGDEKERAKRFRTQVRPTALPGHAALAQP